MNATGKRSPPVKSRAGKPVPEASPQPPAAPEACRRCGTPGPVGDDGFCGKCEKALEQACL